jgi:MFS family permease
MRIGIKRRRAGRHRRGARAAAHHPDLLPIGTAIAASANGVLALGVGVVAIGATVGGMMPLFSNLVAQRYGLENFGRVTGVVHAFAALSGLAPSIAGWIRDAGSDYSMAFYSLLLPIVPALFIFLRLLGRPVPPVAAAAGERLVTAGR